MLLCHIAITSAKAGPGGQGAEFMSVLFIQSLLSLYLLPLIPTTYDTCEKILAYVMF